MEGRAGGQEGRRAGGQEGRGQGGKEEGMTCDGREPKSKKLVITAFQSASCSDYHADRLGNEADLHGRVTVDLMNNSGIRKGGVTQLAGRADPDSQHKQKLNRKRIRHL
jgi:hypothetical protein